ncbi:hypothetical protein Lal_00017415 [Lupinus albus]|uniref:non-specific serine/threonine protein kinase n=1 Tax=Lupinus albus TaxID=3870 RepID=A0A6A4QQC5_LUPAL|nr:putative transferase, protein kinase RLK-Pelle-LRR-IX family [Lupinus albus]KAF1869838.1 hypothetical protein Lal_00017415 [Lupinus albus]
MQKVRPSFLFSSSIVLHFFIVIFSVFFLSVYSQDDAAIMNLLKKSINGSSNLHWSDPDFCKWNNIRCNSGRVTAIQISYSNIQGSLPKELVNLTELQIFECSNNAIMGPVPYMPMSLQKFSINNNNFNSMPNDFFKGMTNLAELRIDYNPFSQWNIPDSLQDCISLRSFSGMNASFVGRIPSFFGKDGPFQGLAYLALAFNYLEGELPSSFSGSSIERLLVNGQQSMNKLNGTIDVLQNMTFLKQIWVRGNSFTGPIPDLSNHDQLYDVSLRDNKLTGVVPPSLINLPSLTVVNLTNNYLQGPLPKFRKEVGVDNDVVRGGNRFCTNQVDQPCSPLVNALLSVVEPLGYPLTLADSWKGNDPCARGNNEWLGIFCSGSPTNITMINFQNRGLSGTISPKFASFMYVTRLLLGNNNLTGTIPNELASMPALKELDVSNNQLYGQIPSFRQEVVVKTSGNPNLGKIITPPPVPNPTPDSGNNPVPSPGIHPAPDSVNNPAPDSGNNPGAEGNKLNIGVIVGIVVGVVFLIGIGVMLCIKFCRKHKQASKVENPNTIVVHPYHSGDGKALKMSAFSSGSSVRNVESGNMVISVQVLREVTDNFSEKNILGKGGFGTVYKGELHDGTMIAVKRMESGIVGEGEKGLTEFKSEIAVLTKVRHRHLVALLGHCLDGNEKLLVYEYMPQGTLSEHLFDRKGDNGSKPLDWKRRLIIALDVARGVEYLHSLAQQIFIHRDLKPSNILLGDDMRAKVSDFGLVRLAPEGQASFETRLAGTFGYLAPEYAVTGRVTTKVDVYSYGVILMEMITGRKSIDNSQPEENIHLVTWFRRMILNKDSFEKIIDPAIDVDEEALDSFRTVAELAGHCCAREPYQRPDMSHVVNVLAPLVEIWKPTESSLDEIYGIDLDMSLPQALNRWQALEGRSTFGVSSSMYSDHTHSSLPAGADGFGDSIIVGR